MKKSVMLVLGVILLIGLTIVSAYSYGCSEDNGWICPDGFECNRNNGVCTTLNPASNPEQEIEQRNIILNQFFVNRDFNDWLYQPGFIYYNQSSPCLSEDSTSYDATYLETSSVGVHVFVMDFSSKIENKVILENLIGCNVQENIKLQSKTSNKNTYIFAQIPQTATYADGTRETFNTDHLLWYEGTKIIYLMYYGDSLNSDTGKQVLTAYFDKYPSELVAPPGLFQRMIDFFKRLFGKE